MNTQIKKLITYAEKHNLIAKEDEVFVINRLLELIGTDVYDAPYENYDCIELEEVLGKLTDFAIENKTVEFDSQTVRDLFDTKLMGAITPLPSEVIKKFFSLYSASPETATLWFYQFCKDVNYIRDKRVQKDLKWKTQTKYGEIDITINLSKPEKDPKAIAQAKLLKQSGYPKCMLCTENEGYAGRMNHPARQNLRTIPILLNNEQWGFQYSPYVYYNEHCIAFNKVHTPMIIDKSTFIKLFDFVKQFPHYFVGSNADLGIVGGSILTHEHFQGGNYSFAMAKADIEKHYGIKGFEDIEVGRVRWPMSVIRLRGKETNRLCELSSSILSYWRKYSDEKQFIFAETNDEKHNTITPIARKNGEMFEIDLVLRNNITTKEHPLGVFHPHSDKHNIKKENIGLIEVMGLAVLPSRLKNEMEILKDAILSNTDFRLDETIGKHYSWYLNFKDEYDFTENNIDDILKYQIGRTFESVLEDAGVFKRTENGLEAFDRFMSSFSSGEKL